MLHIVNSFLNFLPIYLPIYLYIFWHYFLVSKFNNLFKHYREQAIPDFSDVRRIVVFNWAGRCKKDIIKNLLVSS